MNPRRRLLAAALALTTALPLAACGDDESAATLDTITVMSPLFGTAPDPNGEIQKGVEALIGKKLDISWVPDADYRDKVNVTLGSNNIPDVMILNEKSPTFAKTAEAGAFWDLTGKLDKYPNLKPADPQTGKNVQVNGKTYSIYRVRPLLRSAVSVRKDWLAKVGLPLPESVPDLYNVAKAFTEQDPDGNGRKDTYGLIIPKWNPVYASGSPYDIFETWFGAPSAWGERGGRLVPGFDTDEFFAANRELKKWVDEGLVNPDFATLDTANWMDPFVQGKGGIIIDVNLRATQLFDLFREKDPKDPDKVAMVGNLKRADGQKFSAPGIGYRDSIAISKQRIRTEEQLDQVLQVLDRLQSKEGTTLLTNGIAGRNFELDGNYAVPINQDDPQIKVIKNDVEKAFIQLGTRASIGMETYPWKPSDPAKLKLYESFGTLMTEDLKTAVHNPAASVLAPTQIQQGGTLDPIVPDARVKFLSGTITEEQLKAEVKRWYDGGGTKIVQEVNEMAK
ncbi:extracellular solute-binding protein [Actinoplanes sp. CA-252034]|uniref:extracellular solute-binding protein n=1 Tax=Actinoplanes sp. CA-252034 TaxID=3239906 RepID=UPI003D99E3E1